MCSPCRRYRGEIGYAASASQPTVTRCPTVSPASPPLGPLATTVPPPSRSQRTRTSAPRYCTLDTVAGNAAPATVSSVQYLGARARGARRGRHAHVLGSQGPRPVAADDPPGDVAGEEVRQSDEAGDEGGGRSLVDVARRADLLDPARGEDGDAVAHRQGLALVVGDVHEGDAHRRLDGLQLHLHLLPQLEVERAERLVEEQDARPVDQCAGERHALALTARELRRPAVAVGAEAHALQRLAHACGALGGRDALHLEPVADVVGDGHVGEEGVVLEHGVDVALERRHAGHVAAAEQDRARRRRLEARDHAQHRGLAGSGRAEQGEELSVTDVERHVVDRDDVAERLAHAAQHDRGRHGGHDSRGS